MKETILNVPHRVKNTSRQVKKIRTNQSIKDVCKWRHKCFHSFRFTMVKKNLTT